MKKLIDTTMERSHLYQQIMHWAAFTYVAALYLTIVSVQSYTIYVEQLLG